MTGASMDFSELDKLSADLRGVSEKVGPQAQRILRKSISDVTAGGKRRAPRDTGFLASSISNTDLRTVGQKGVLEAESGPTANYGGYVERGTSRQAPQPYMAPALAAVEPGFVAAFEALGGEIL